MGIFGDIKGFFNKSIARPAQSFFRKDIAAPTRSFFSKGGPAENVLGGIKRGIGAVSGVINNPLVKMGLTALAPEFALPLQAASTLLDTGSRLASKDVYKGPLSKVAGNVLEITKQPSQAQPSFY